jgi:subtilase family serine protease
VGVSYPKINPDHIKVLKAALANMQTNYASFANFTPGPQDIFDYNIGNLWLTGIDGTGTTVAVIEGWDDPGIATFIHTSDVRYGLPDPARSASAPASPTW